MARKRVSPPRTVVREIEVEVAGDEQSGAAREPKALVLAGRRYAVSEVVGSWHDESFSGGFRRDAWLGHERFFYRVRTESGDLFDIYYDAAESHRRGKDRWVLHRRLSQGPTPSPPEGGAGAQGEPEAGEAAEGSEP